MSLEKAIEQLADAINNHAEAMRALSAQAVSANEPVAAQEEFQFVTEHISEAIKEDKPKRGRRPKAEIEAAKVAEEVEEEPVAEESVTEEPAAQEEEEEEEEEDKEEPPKVYELSDIQKALMKIAALGEDARRAAKGIPLSLGYAKSADVPKEKYPEMVQGIYQVNKEIAEAIWGKK